VTLVQPGEHGFPGEQLVVVILHDHRIAQISHGFFCRVLHLWETEQSLVGLVSEEIFESCGTTRRGASSAIAFVRGTEGREVDAPGPAEVEGVGSICMLTILVQPEFRVESKSRRRVGRSQVESKGGTRV
jgi:hypothetical protein